MADKLYAERDIEALSLRNHYLKHIESMTSEELHSKSAIAAELAHRDLCIENLKEAVLSVCKAHIEDAIEKEYAHQNQYSGEDGFHCRECAGKKAEKKGNFVHQSICTVLIAEKLIKEF